MTRIAIPVKNNLIDEYLMEALHSDITKAFQPAPELVQMSSKQEI